MNDPPPEARPRRPRLRLVLYFAFVLATAPWVPMLVIHLSRLMPLDLAVRLVAPSSLALALGAATLVGAVSGSGSEAWYRPMSRAGTGPHLLVLAATVAHHSAGWVVVGVHWTVVIQGLAPPRRWWIILLERLFRPTANLVEPFVIPSGIQPWYYNAGLAVVSSIDSLLFGTIVVALISIARRLGRSRRAVDL